MKKILITGEGSYIGTSFEKYISDFAEYEVETVDMIDGSWREKDFSVYDVVFHVAGIAHIRETEKNKHKYYQVNRDIAVETAEKAKRSGVRHFVLMSSMAVFGLTTGIITKNTEPSPKTNYGKSKLEADKIIEKMADDFFAVSILRPPMVYGQGCKGNYSKLEKLVNKFPVFPYYENKRSMINIDTLCQKIKKIIDMGKTGFYYPQDEEYVCTSEMVRQIAEKNGKKIFFIKCFNIFIRKSRIGLINKIFGDLVYDKSIGEV